LVGWAHGIRSGYLLTAYALVTMTGSVTLGWHYAVDGYLGAFLAWGCWMLAGYLTPPVSASAIWRSLLHTVPASKPIRAHDSL
jgi:hypothetical protein